MTNDDLRSDYDMIVDQFSTIIESGHFIFPHIPPNWSYANYNQEIKQWNFNELSNYSFSLVSNNIKVELLEHSFAFIKKMQNKCNVHYEIDSFRDSGCCIQPFSDFKELFEKLGSKMIFHFKRLFYGSGKVLL